MLQQHLLTFEQQWTDAASGRTLPKFVTEELHKYLEAIGESKRFFERWRTLPDRSIATSIAGAERSVAAFATV